MPDDLPPPIVSYFEASNRQDADAVAAAFVGGARVRDEEREMLGRAAIREWAEDTFSKYRHRAMPKGIRASGDAAVVLGQITGTFPGSPIELDFRFTIVGEKIASLEIG